MQAARAGAEKVFACEMFKSWANIAKQNVEENHYRDVITVFNKHSSELTLEGMERNLSNEQIWGKNAIFW